VPLGWNHPTEFQRDGSGIQHVPLYVGYADALREWEQGKVDWERREGHNWEWSVQYHVTGYFRQDRGGGGAWQEPTPIVDYADDGRPIATHYPKTEDELADLVSYVLDEPRPDPADYMPEFEGDPDAFGWCLYETVSEGTPTTPVFATAEELIEHLVTVGEVYDQVPYRREAAETLVGRGRSEGTMILVDGVVYHSARDADKIAELPRRSGANA
jgi:hypothetical protein